MNPKDKKSSQDKKCDSKRRERVLEALKKVNKLHEKTLMKLAE